MLELDQVYAFYDHVAVLKGVSLKLGENEIVTLIGANGAGKTTTLMTISGLVKVASGNIRYHKHLLQSMNPNEIVKMGISQAPEGRQIFPRLNVMENLEMGAYVRDDRDRITEDIKKVFSLFPVLKERQFQKAGTLSGGEQQMLAMGRALMAKPKVLLLDEPSLGLAPRLIETIFNIIRQVHEMGTSILLVEQNAKMALSIAQRGYVLETGKIVLEDTAKNLLKNRLVRKSYLGG